IFFILLFSPVAVFSQQHFYIGGTKVDIITIPPQNYDHTYFVSNTGNDNADGKSFLTAWQTISHANSYGSYANGDTIAYKGGDIWSGTMFTVPHSHLVINSYGTGQAHINGAETAGTWIQDTGGLYHTFLNNTDTAVYTKFMPL